MMKRQMDMMWAPWRASYVEKHGKKPKGCVFCRICKAYQDKKHYIFLRSKHVYAVLNIYPFNGGHSLIVPYRHTADIANLTPEELDHMWEMLLRVKALLQKALKPQAFNIGLNVGASAGAGIPKHVHMHIVPRWSGDVNFMPALFATRVMPVSLDQVYKRLMDAQKK
jgi:ATP adenylyltransferase